MFSFMLFFGLLVSFMFTVMVYVVYIVAISFTLWMAMDAAKEDRFWWIVLVIGVPVIGPVAYYFVEKKHEYKHTKALHVHKTETEALHEKSGEEK